MRVLTSRVGFVLATLYVACAIFAIRQDLVYPAGGWIKLSGMSTFIVTLPSQASLGMVLENLGVPRIDFDHTGVADYAQLSAHVLVTAVIVYLIGFGIEWVVRRVFRSRPA